MRESIVVGRTRLLGLQRVMARGMAIMVIGAMVGLAASPLFSATANAAEPTYVTLGAGAFEVNNGESSGLFNLEYVGGRKLIWDFRPLAGAFATAKGSLYGYAGLSLDLYLTPRFVVTPSFAPGLYVQNGDQDLGSAIEFRTAIQAAYLLHDRSRIGLQAFHLSNAGIGSRDPSADAMLLFYSIPVP